ncbi:hypothetical protein NPIL_385851 [Nephila pilipes]|uniref:Uncharacterized protein n=1 Tax=Nephila pilipes TaxID=299642 RepID=A0A8X6PHS9_NEPPI|nr:hypothetical protein NPIL_385851 [Nephila pilipes]
MQAEHCHFKSANTISRSEHSWPLHYLPFRHRHSKSTPVCRQSMRQQKYAACLPPAAPAFFPRNVFASMAAYNITQPPCSAYAAVYKGVLAAAAAARVSLIRANENSSD